MIRDKFAENKGIIRFVISHPKNNKNRRVLVKLRVKTLAEYKELGWNLYPNHRDKNFIKDKKHIYS